MRYKLSGFFSGLVVVFALCITSVSAQTPGAADIIARMQAITEQMEELQTEFSSLTTALRALSGSGSVLGAQTSAPTTSSDVPIFTEDLSYGVTNDDIARIQRLLATDPEIYPYGVDSGFFGPKTQEAINNLQDRFGYDPVGVIGPATRAMLEGWMRAYPDENYPDGILTTRPSGQVAGASTSSGSSSLLERLQQQLAQLTDQQSDEDEEEEDDTPRRTGTLANNPAKTIEVAFDGDSAQVHIEFNDDDEYDDEDFRLSKVDSLEEAAKELTYLTFLSLAEINDVIVEVDRLSGGSGDEDEADEAIEDAEDAIDDAADEIEEADDDGEDVDYAEDLLEDAEDLLDDAEEAYDDKDYDKAIEKAEKAAKKAEDAEDAIGEEERDNDDIDSIEVEVDEDGAEVVVEWDNGDDEEFDVDETEAEDIIEAIAKELDVDEDDVEDVIEFDYGDIDSIDVEIRGIDSLADIEFESGLEISVRILEKDEDEIIKEIAKMFDLDEDDVEDVIDFD